MKYLRFIILLGSLWCFVPAQGQKLKQQFPLNETLKFKISYGWFSLGEALVSIKDSLHFDKSEAYYRTTVDAGTIGLFSWLAGIEDHYEGLVHTETYRASYNEKQVRHRKENFDQWNSFDYENMKVYAKTKDYLKKRDKSKVVDLTENTYDILGTYLFLRSRNWSGYRVGDSILIKTFYEDKLYDFGMEYGGEETIKFEGRRVKTSKFYILFPVSKTFPKEKAVTVWVTQRNQMTIPLQIEADMKIGKVWCELESYSVNGVDNSGLFD